MSHRANAALGIVQYIPNEPADAFREENCLSHDAIIFLTHSVIKIPSSSDARREYLNPVM